MKRLILITGLMLSVIFPCATWAIHPITQMLCGDPRFNCIHVHGGDTWDSLFPDPDEQNLVMRANRINAPLWRGMLLAVPNDPGSMRVDDLNPMDNQIPPAGHKVIIVDPKVDAWGAYDADGQLVKWGPASTGADWCSDLQSTCHTPTGDFMIYAKNGVDCESSKFPLGEGHAPMPFCMFFHEGFALHGSPEVPGFNASHGCVRIFFNDAEWLNEEFIDVPTRENHYKGTEVVIKPYANEGDKNGTVSSGSDSNTTPVKVNSTNNSSG